MKFEELEARLRAFETFGEERLKFDSPLIARLDGRGFTHLTKNSLDLEKPFDIRFHEAMKASVTHLCDCGFAVRLAFSHSDEISLLFEPNERGFDGKIRKWLSVLAGEASAAFSLHLGCIGAFDCRLIVLPNNDTVIDYFRWRQSDALRNALNAHCYWILRAKSQSRNAATKRLEGLSVEQKQELLMEPTSKPFHIGKRVALLQIGGKLRKLASIHRLKSKHALRVENFNLKWNSLMAIGLEIGFDLRFPIEHTVLIP